MSKYRPLSDRLASEQGEEWRPSFAEIEEVLGFPLPKAAQQAAWWTGGEKPHHKAWTEHGWEVGEVDRAAGGVHFRRAPVGLSAGPLESTAADPSVNKPSEAVAPPAKVRHVAGNSALVAGAVAILAGVSVLGARLLFRTRD